MRNKFDDVIESKLLLISDESEESDKNPESKSSFQRTSMKTIVSMPYIL